MVEKVNKIKYKPFRGHETILNVRKSEVIFYPNHLEAVLDYDYVAEVDEEPEIFTVRDITLIPKAGLLLTITQGWGDDDSAYTVAMTTGQDRVFFWFETEKEAANFYTKIRKELVRVWSPLHLS